MFRQFIALHIELGLNFGSDILRNVLGPMFEGVECDDAKRIAELMSGTRLTMSRFDVRIWRHFSDIKMYPRNVRRRGWNGWGQDAFRLPVFDPERTTLPNSRT